MSKLRIGVSINFDVDRVANKVRWWPGIWIGSCMNFKCGPQCETEKQALEVAKEMALKEFRERKQTLFPDQINP